MEIWFGCFTPNHFDLLLFDFERPRLGFRFSMDETFRILSKSSNVIRIYFLFFPLLNLHFMNYSVRMQFLIFLNGNSIFH